MDTTAELNSEQNSSTAASAPDSVPPESIGGIGGPSEFTAPSISEPAPESRTTAIEGGGAKTSAAIPQLELVSYFEPRERGPRIEGATAKSSRNFALPGIAAALALLFLLGAGAVYERVRQTSLFAAKVQENEHLVSSVSNLTERLDAIEAARAREQTADVRKLLGEIKLGASATRDVSAAITQLTARVDHVERDQGARMDKLAERIDHDSSSRFADLAARLDKLEKKAALPVVASVAPAPPKPAPDISGPIAQLTSRVDKLGDRIEHESSARLAELTARLDKLEKNAVQPTLASVAPTPSKPAPVPAKLDPIVSNETTGAIEKSRAPLRGYAVLEVRDGLATIEGREGSISVAPGDAIPGVGRVLRIERRGREWTVVTTAGVIGAEAEPY